MSEHPRTPSFGQIDLSLDESDTDPPSTPLNGEHHDGYENGGGKIPKLLPKDATHEEMVRAINGIAIEIQLTRQAVAKQGTRVGEHEEAVKASLAMIEKAIINRLQGIESMLRPALKANKPRKQRAKKGK